MADHGYFEELICAQLDGELTAEQARELDAHLAECERCRAFREALTAAEGVSARHLPAPPEELTDRVMAAVRAEAKAKKKGRILGFPGRSLAVAAAAALVLWAGVRAADMFRPKVSSAAPMAAAAESSTAAYGSIAEEEAVESEYAGEESMDAANGPAEEPAETFSGFVVGNARPEEGAGEKGAPAADALCQISNREGAICSLPVSELPEGLLIPDKACADPDREPDYIMLIYVPDGDPEEYWFWEQDGVMIVETNTGEFGYTVSTEVFLELLDH